MACRSALDTHKQLIREGEEELDAEHLFFWLEGDVDLEHEEVRFPILVSVLLLDLKSERSML